MSPVRRDPAAPSPEHELTLLLCQTEPVRARHRDDVVRLADAADPARLAAIMRRHGVLPLCGSRLRDALGGVLPSLFAEEVEQAAAVCMRRSVLLEAVTASLVQDLESAGIPALPLKGVMLGRRVHGDGGLRPSVDVDILVSRQDFRAAGEIVQARGYAPSNEVPIADGMPNLHDTFETPNGALPELELHWRIHWYDSSFSEKMLGRSVKDEAGIPSPALVDDLASLLLFYQRDSFLGLKLATDISAWWDAYGDELPDGALDQIVADHPALRDALVASAAVVERVVGVPGRRLITSAPRHRRRADWAARLADWSFDELNAQGIANLALIDWLLTPPGGQRAYVRMYLFQHPAAFARQHGLPEVPRARDHVRRLGHAVARTAKAATRLSLVLWRIRGGGFWVPLPTSLRGRALEPGGSPGRKNVALPSVVETCPVTSSARSVSPSSPTSQFPESPSSPTSEAGRA